MRAGFHFAALALVTATAFGQATAPLSGPVEGFTFDEATLTFRAVIGRLGSSSLGPALESGFDFGSVAPFRDYGIGLANGTAFVIAGLSGPQPSTAPLSGVFSVPEGAAWSDDGSTAVLYSRAGNWIQSVTGFPVAPQAGPALSLSSLGGSLTAVSISGRGEHIIFGLSGRGVGIFELSGQSFVPLLELRQPVAFSFTPDGGTVFALDRASRQVTTLNLADRSTQILPVADLRDPVAIAFAASPAGTSSAGTLFVAGRKDRALVQYDLSTSQRLFSSALNFDPEGFQPLGRGSYLFGNRRTVNDPMWSFVSGPTPAIYFVPATPLSAGGQQ